LENVFVDLQELGAKVVGKEVFEKPKRSAFVFITAELDSSSDVLMDLRKIDEVKEVYLARGAYDIVAKISGDSFDSLRENVVNRIKNLTNIKSTLTLTVI
jgi:DNA-binding Lrp family transcriptional regulator